MNTLLRVVHISDTHIHPDANYRHYNAPSPLTCVSALVDAVNALPFQPDFILHSGDIVYNPDPEAYAATKAAVIQFSRVVAVEYAPKGVRVNTVVPGQLHTPMVEARLAGQRAGSFGEDEQRVVFFEDLDTAFHR